VKRLVALGLSVTLFGAVEILAQTDDELPLAKTPFDAKQARTFQQQWAKQLGKEMVYTNTIGMKMVLLPPGEFRMGGHPESARREIARLKVADPETYERLKSRFPTLNRRVRITRPFYMGAHEITVGQIRQFVEISGYKTQAERGLHYGHPGRSSGHTWRTPMRYRSEYKDVQTDDHPVMHLCWYDCQEFCDWLNAKEGEEYYLPTSAEWEYACRAGTMTPFSFGDFEDYDQIAEQYAWMSEDHKRAPYPIPVGQKKPNNFGLYDMHGNMWELVADRNHDLYMYLSPVNDPPGPAWMNEIRDGRTMIRGGSFDWPKYGATSDVTIRIRKDSHQHAHVGFRVARRIKGAQGVPPAPEFEGPTVRGKLDPSEIVDPAAAQKTAITDQRPKDLKIDLGNGVHIDLVLIPAGSFMMGSLKGPRYEKPLQKVTLTKPFYMAIYEVTQAQWQAVMRRDASLTRLDDWKWQGMTAFLGPNKPMPQISWSESSQFIQKLRTKIQGHEFSLPTEAQWEYACRAGSTTDYCFGDDPEVLHQYALVCKVGPDGFRDEPSSLAVGQKKPNAWGLYDMHGSLWEHCADWYAQDYYANSPVQDPSGPKEGTRRVVRGGSRYRYGLFARSAFRCSFHPDTSPYSDTGLRLVINLP